MKSLQLRLSVGLSVSLVLLFTLAWFFLRLGLQELLEHHLQGRLQHDAESILASLDFTPEGYRFEHGQLGTLYTRVFSGHYFSISIPATETLRSRSLWDHTLPSPDVAVGSVQLLRLTGPEQQPLLVRSAGYLKQDRKLVISTAEDLTPIQAQIHTMQGWLAGISVSILLLVVVAQRLIVTHSLRPLQQTRNELKQLIQGELQALGEQVPSELLPLVREINLLLQFNHQRLQRSRNALGNLAHALKTPTTLLQHLADDEALAPHPELQHALRNHVQTIQQYIQRELRRGRLAGATHSTTRTHMATIVNDLSDVFMKIYADKHLQIDAHIPDQLQLAVDSEDLNELLGNLMDNACKWARHRVSVTCSRTGNRLSIEIDDDGPGVAEDELQQLSQRGMRLDEVTPGHGLGLAIAREISELYHGRLQCRRSSLLGGLQVAIEIPANGHR